MTTVSIFGTEVSRHVLVAVGVAIVAAASMYLYLWGEESHDVPRWGIIATAAVLVVVAFGWHWWTRRRPMQRADPSNPLSSSDTGSALGLGDGESALGLGDGGSVFDVGSAADLRLSDRRFISSTRRDEDAESLFNLSESFMTVQSFPKVRR